MARITMRKVQETKLSEVFTLYLASAAARGVKDKTLRTYEQHFNAISKRLDVDGNISLITSKDLDKMILRMREDVRSELVKHSVRVKNLRLFTKTQNPAEELVTFFCQAVFTCELPIVF